MPIDLPPAIPPQLADLRTIERLATGSAPVAATVGDYEVRVTGDHHLDEREVLRILAAAETPSQAILMLAAATHREGYLLVTNYYTPRHNVVQVHAVRGRLTGLDGSRRIVGYFAGLEGEDRLERAQFDRARVMAKVYSERSGLDYSISYRHDEADPEAVTMVFNESLRVDYKPWQVMLQIGNQGDRFAGRYIADAGMKYNFADGTRVAAGYQRAFPELGESLDTEDFQQFQVRADRPSRWGLYGLDASYAEYTQELGPVAVAAVTCSFSLLGTCLAFTSSSTDTFFDLDAEILRVGLDGEQVLSSDVNHRFNLFQRAEYVDSRIEVNNSGEAIQDEVYTTLELGARYQSIHTLDENSRLQWGLRASAVAGLGGDSGTLGSDDSSPAVAVGKRSAEFVALKPEALIRMTWGERKTLELNLKAQFADEQLPQQQQWVLGGIDHLSAYLPGALVGDNGYFARAQYSYRWNPGWARITASAFAEYGAASFENAGRDPASDATRNFGSTTSIADAGIGLSVEFLNLELRAVAAESFHEDNIGDAALARYEADFFAVLKATF